MLSLCMSLYIYLTYVSVYVHMCVYEGGEREKGLDPAF